MVITNKKKVVFEDIKAGDCFKIDDNYYIKSHDGNKYVGVNLADGCRKLLNYDDFVTPINATITIE